jgi:hypothetical protein
MDDEVLQSYQEVDPDSSMGLSDEFTHSSMQIMLFNNENA